jgi:hypothetical protein
VYLYFSTSPIGMASFPLFHTHGVEPVDGHKRFAVGQTRKDETSQWCQDTVHGVHKSHWTQRGPGDRSRHDRPIRCQVRSLPVLRALPCSSRRLLRAIKTEGWRLLHDTSSRGPRCCEPTFWRPGEALGQLFDVLRSRRG